MSRGLGDVYKRQKVLLLLMANLSYTQTGEGVFSVDPYFLVYEPDTRPETQETAPPKIQFRFLRCLIDVFLHVDSEFLWTPLGSREIVGLFSILN